MYVKIVEYLDANGVFPKHGNGDLVVPTRNHIFEIDNIEYKKVRITSQKELDDALLGIEEYTFIGYLPEICNCEPQDGCSSCSGGGTNFEILIISMYSIDKDIFQNFVAPGCHLYIMNEQGKTIDSLICH